jgi:hypothetical protein
MSPMTVPYLWRKEPDGTLSVTAVRFIPADVLFYDREDDEPAAAQRAPVSVHREFVATTSGLPVHPGWGAREEMQG